MRSICFPSKKPEDKGRAEQPKEAEAEEEAEAKEQPEEAPAEEGENDTPTGKPRTSATTPGAARRVMDGGSAKLQIIGRISSRWRRWISSKPRRPEIKAKRWPR